MTEQLLLVLPNRPRFNGPDYDPGHDRDRLKKQLGRVYEIMKDGRRRSLQEIQTAIESKFNIRDPESSISAQLRHLRKERFGNYNIQRDRAENSGTWLYWMNGKSELKTQ